MSGSGRLRVLLLMSADVACIVVAWNVSVFGYLLVGSPDYVPSIFLRLWPIVPVAVVLNILTGTYHGNWLYPAMPVGPAEELRRLFLNALLLHVGLAAVIGFARNTDFSRVAIVLAGLVTACTAQMFRDGVRALLKRRGLAQIPVLLSGEGPVADRVARSLARSAYYGLEVVRHAGDNRSVATVAKAHGIRVLLACQDPRIFRVQLEEFVKWFHHIEYLPTSEAFPVADGRAIAIDGIGGLEMVNQVRMKAQHLEKGVLDRMLAAVIFLCALPCFLVVPVLIKLTSRGPVFYRAKRLGKDGRPIRIWKFRSMYADADARLQSLLEGDPALREEFERDFKLKDDPRVTPLGRILRKTSIDELPQLLNVFTGEMALIGPRPIVEKEIPYYGKAFGIFSSVKPGITGLWQCSGRSDCDYVERVALDVRYVLNWSPWLDIWIVFRTAAAVLKMKGSY